MKFLRKNLDKLAPQFGPNGPYAALGPVFDAVDSYLFTPADVTPSTTHVRDAMDFKRVMFLVVVALVPCIMMALYNTGYQANVAIAERVDAGDLAQATTPGWRGDVLEVLGVGYSPRSLIACLVHGALYFLPIFLVTQIAGGTVEVLSAILRKQPVGESFLVTGLLYPLILPPTVPLWQVALGIVVGLIVSKELFGGAGRNVLNPALAAKAFLYFVFPLSITGNSVWVALPGYDMPTPLGRLASLGNVDGLDVLTLGHVNGVPMLPPVTWSDGFWGFVPGAMGDTSTFAVLLGAALLLATRIASWKIMAGVVIGMLGTGAACHLLAPYSDIAMYDLPPHWHLVLGGAAFGLVFMATDPVSAAKTETGRWIYGLFIGVVTILVRMFDPLYPEGIMWAILLGNCIAPWIDYVVLRANVQRRLSRATA